jgi:hypothetical protein
MCKYISKDSVKYAKIQIMINFEENFRKPSKILDENRIDI